MDITMHTLADLPLGVPARIRTHHSTFELSTRLRTLVLRPGRTVSLHQKTSGGGYVIRVGSSRYALDRATLHTVEVESLEETKK